MLETQIFLYTIAPKRRIEEQNIIWNVIDNREKFSLLSFCIFFHRSGRLGLDEIVDIVNRTALTPQQNQHKFGTKIAPLNSKPTQNISSLDCPIDFPSLGFFV